MGLKRMSYKVSVRLGLAAVSFLCAFVLFHILVGIGFKKVEETNALFLKQQMAVNTFVSQMISEINQMTVTGERDGDAVVSAAETGILLRALTDWVDNKDEKNMSEYMQRSLSEISSVIKQLNLNTSSTEPDVKEQRVLLGQLNDKLVSLLDQENSNANDQLNKMVNVRDKIRRGIILWMLIVLLVVTFMYVLIVRSLRKKLYYTLQFSEKIASGDLSASAAKLSNDEIGQINQAVVSLRDRLREVMNSVKEITTSILTASEEFSSGAQVISKGASSQAASAEEISAAMEQIAEGIKQSAQNAGETGKIAQNAYEGIQHGANKAESALKTIEEIARKNSIIGEISYQTKILSINASVEAARAAELGRGFAVVAGEVKRLAETTQSSAYDINDVSKKGVALTSQSASELRTLVEEFKKTSDLVTQIAEVSNEHTNTIEQINFSLQDLNNITQQNASSAEELAASSDELLKLTYSLEDLISYFKLDSKEIPEQEGSADVEPDVKDTPQPLSDNNISSFKQDAPVYEEDKHSDAIASPGLSEPLKKKVGEAKPEMLNLKDDVLETKPIAEKQSFLKQGKNDNSVEKKADPAKEEKLKATKKGIRINLADNDDLDSQFEKMK